MQQQKTRRLCTKVKSLKGIVSELKSQQLITEKCELQLTQSLSAVPHAIIERIRSGKNGKGCSYPPELRAFALTLQFYSAKAYEFVRQTFDLALPHQANIRKWYSKIPADPGFTEPAFKAIEAKVEAASANGKKVICALMLDEMAIRKQVAWDGTQFTGFVNLGNGADDDDSSPLAKEALVFMAVSINDSWKIPCAYFFLDGLSGSERANLIKVCLQRLADTGAHIKSITFDGPSCHFKMAKELGAVLNVDEMKPSFSHPSDPNQSVHVLLDVCHMLKLVRNTLADGGLIFDGNGSRILWQYVENLHKLQDHEGLRLGNKLKAPHIQWRQQKMKVNLAAQTLSSSVADAIEYCATTLKLDAFKGSEATVQFIRIFDRVFDILNSRNPFARGFKSPLRTGNKPGWLPFLDTAFKYISSLKDHVGNAMHSSRRRTGFVGFLVAIKSTKELFHELVEVPDAPLKYLLTYKFSQDHLELFFGAIRSAGGFNNNPTTQQFTAAYKRLLLRSHIKGGRGNCIERDCTSILQILGDTFVPVFSDISCLPTFQIIPNVA